METHTRLISSVDALQWQQLTSKGGKGRGASSAPSARRWHTLSPLSEGSSNVFLFGGYNGGKEPLGDAYILNLGTKAVKYLFILANFSIFRYRVLERCEL